MFTLKVDIMKFGLKIHPMKGWINHVKLAEKSGFDYIWFGADHLYMDSCSALAFAATKTRKIKLAPFANSVYLRHPVYLASAMALIDEMSGGRAVAAICSAGYEATVRLNIEAKEPLIACKEAIEVMRALWKGDPVNYHGKFFYLDDVKLTYAGRPDLPIYLATRGRKFKLAGELCDGTVTHGKGSNFVKRMVDNVKEGAKRAGRRLEDIDIAIVLPFKIARTHKDVETFKKNLKPLMTGFVGGEWPLDWADTLGLTTEELEPIQEAVLREHNFIKARNFVSDELLNRLLDAFCIVGTPEECISEVEALEKAGVTQLIPMVNRRIPEPEFKREMGEFPELFGKKIIQSFRG